MWIDIKEKLPDLPELCLVVVAWMERKRTYSDILQGKYVDKTWIVYNDLIGWTKQYNGRVQFWMYIPPTPPRDMK
jgi:hypothetical protein